MRLIDQKGMLLGRINIIDFLVIVFLISIAPMFYSGYKIFKNNPNIKIQTRQETKKQFVEIELDSTFIKLKPEVAKIIAVGDKQFDDSGKPIGEIIEVGKISPHLDEFSIGTVGRMVKEDLIMKQVPVKLRIKAENREGDLYYGNSHSQIVNNLPSEFITDKYRAFFLPLFNKEINTIMTDIKGVELEQRLNIIENKLNGLDDKINNIELNSKVTKINNIELRSMVTKLTNIENRLNKLETEKLKKNRNNK